MEDFSVSEKIVLEMALNFFIFRTANEMNQNQSQAIAEVFIERMKVANSLLERIKQ